MTPPGARLRELIEAPELLVMPGAHDALSARLIAQAGFSAVMAGGFAAAGTLLGEPDAGQMTLNDYAAHYGRIAGAVEVPVFVDADTGFGGVNSVRRTVRAFSRAGIAGLFMEDQTMPKRCGYVAGKSVIPVDEMIAKIRAALAAREDDTFVICARTDAWSVLGPEAAIERARAYRAAGADMTFVQGADDLADLTKVCTSVPGPQLANLSHASGRRQPSVAEIAATGAAAVMFPSATLFAAAGAVGRALAALRNDGRFAAAEPDFITASAYNEAVDLESFIAREN
jgi:2-methylisocitrate lyase-like PEP mutase family enzyme